jgi:hypothetical protein
MRCGTSTPTFIRLLDGTCAYLQAVIDNFSRRILAWRVADTVAPVNSVFVIIEASLGATPSRRLGRVAAAVTASLRAADPSSASEGAEGTRPIESTPDPLDTSTNAALPNVPDDRLVRMRIREGIGTVEADGSACRLQ